jgi:hypothetical protein
MIMNPNQQMPKIGPDGKPDMSTLSPDMRNQIRMEIHSTFDGETQFLVDDKYQSIRSLYLSNAAVQQVISTFGMGDKGDLIMTHLLQIPKELYLNQLTEVVLDNGYCLRCSPATLILTKDSWIQASKLTMESKITKIIFNPQSGTRAEYIGIKSVSTEFKALGVASYTVISECQNFLLPCIKPGDNMKSVEFICVHQ